MRIPKNIREIVERNESNLHQYYKISYLRNKYKNYSDIPFLHKVEIITSLPFVLFCIFLIFEKLWTSLISKYENIFISILFGIIIALIMVSFFILTILQIK